MKSYSEIKCLLLMLAFGGEVINNNDDDISQYFEAGDYTYRIDPDFVQKCADMIKEHMSPIMKNLAEIDERRTKKRLTDKNQGFE